MALSANTIWEVRTTGNDTNGGGWVVGSTGTDWSQQASPQYSVTDGVTAGTTTITSATAAFGTDVVGNLVYVSGGTGSITAGWYQIASRTNSTTIVVDRSTGLTTGTGVTLHIGGALATLGALSAPMVSGNHAWVKADGTYTQTTSPSFAQSTSGTQWTWLRGYTTTRGDNGRASIVLSTNTGLTGMVFTSFGISAANFDINCSSLGTSTGMTCTVNANIAWNCKVSNFTSYGFNWFGAYIYGCEITGGTSAATAAFISTQGAGVSYCYIHDNACHGIYQQTQGAINNNLIVNCTGASSCGINVSQYTTIICNNTIYGSGLHGISLADGSIDSHLIKGNLIANSGGWGLLNSQAHCAMVNVDGNAYYSNASGNRSNMDLSTGVFTIGAYTNVQDVVCTTTPFTNAAGKDFSLNNVASGGMLVRNMLQSFPGSTNTGYAQAGCLPVQYPAYKPNRHTRRRHQIG